MATEAQIQTMKNLCEKLSVNYLEAWEVSKVVATEVITSLIEQNKKASIKPISEAQKNLIVRLHENLNKEAPTETFLNSLGGGWQQSGSQYIETLKAEVAEKGIEYTATTKQKELIHDMIRNMDVLAQMGTDEVPDPEKMLMKDASEFITKYINVYRESAMRMASPASIKLIRDLFAALEQIPDEIVIENLNPVAADKLIKQLRKELSERIWLAPTLEKEEMRAMPTLEEDKTWDKQALAQKKLLTKLYAMIGMEPEVETCSRDELEEIIEFVSEQIDCPTGEIVETLMDEADLDELFEIEAAPF